jgi:S-adenosylmethionine decarboxylase
MKRLGRHVLAEFTGCDPRLLNDPQAVAAILKEAARRAEATIVDVVFHQYNPHGLSGVVIIAESHISIHTWPEYGYAAADFFTCGDQVDPWKACQYMKEQLGCTGMETRELQRGIPDRDDGVLPHKPVLPDTAGRTL